MAKKKGNRKKLKIVIFTLIIFGVIGLMILIMGWEDFKINAKVILGDDVSEIKKICKGECEFGNATAFCCNIKSIEKDSEPYNCQQDILKISCELDCGGICERYCGGFRQVISCAKAGCSWILKDKGFCKARKWV